MIKSRVRITDIIYILAIILADLFIYIILGTLLMGYEDQYDKSKGEYWSLASMNSMEKIIYLGLQIWNIINIIGIVYFGYRFYKRKKTHKTIT